MPFFMIEYPTVGQKQGQSTSGKDNLCPYQHGRKDRKHSIMIELFSDFGKCFSQEKRQMGETVEKTLHN